MTLLVLIRNVDMYKPKIYKTFLHQVYSGLGYTVPKLTKSSQLPVTEMTQILIYLAAIGSLSAHLSSGSQYLINAFRHRLVIDMCWRERYRGRERREGERRGKGREVGNIFMSL